MAAGPRTVEAPSVATGADRAVAVPGVATRPPVPVRVGKALLAWAICSPAKPGGRVWARVTQSSSVSGVTESPNCIRNERSVSVPKAVAPERLPPEATPTRTSPPAATKPGTRSLKGDAVVTWTGPRIPERAMVAAPTSAKDGALAWALCTAEESTKASEAMLERLIQRYRVVTRPNARAMRSAWAPYASMSSVTAWPRRKGGRGENRGKTSMGEG